MDAEFLYTFFFQNSKGLEHLRLCKPILGLAGGVHNHIADFKISAGIITEGNYLRNAADGFLQKIYMGNIVKVYYAAQFMAQLEILRRSYIGREHYLAAGNAQLFAEH